MSNSFYNNSFTAAVGSLARSGTIKSQFAAVQIGFTEVEAALAPKASPTFTGTANFGNVAYTGTLTGGTGVVNLGSGQFYKDASGNVGLGTPSPTSKLTVLGTDGTNVIRFRAATGMLRISPYQDATEGSVISAANAAESANVPLTLSASVHRFAIGGAVVVRIDGNGNVTIANTYSAPGAPSGGGVLYVEAGALKFIGSSGTVTTLAPA